MTRIVVDEAQDFADAWWDPLLAALKDDASRRTIRLLRRGPEGLQPTRLSTVPLVPLILDHNVRNTKQIATCFSR